MEGKKRVVPGEICAERAERCNHSHIRKAVLNAQKSAEAIVPWEEKTREGPNQYSRSNRGKENCMERAENTEGSWLQMNSTECEGYAGAQSAVRQEQGETESRQPKLLETILDRDNLNRAYKRVKARTRRVL